MKVYFSHGKESGPWGSKIKRLADIASALGFAVESIDYRETMDPDIRAEKLAKILALDTQKFILVGSSMGGYVSLVAAKDFAPIGIFLLAPALYIPHYKVQKYCYSAVANLEIVHGWSDEVIPAENSIRFAKESDANLHLISGDHRLNSSIEMVEKLFLVFLKTCLAQHQHSLGQNQ